MLEIGEVKLHGQELEGKTGYWWAMIEETTNNAWNKGSKTTWTRVNDFYKGDIKRRTSFQQFHDL